jgi:hypothetical protein
MNNDNQNTLELWEKIPHGCFTLHGSIFPKSQLEEVLQAWFGDKPLPNPQKK